MPINTFPQGASARQPRGIITINGQALPAKSFNIETRNIYEGDVFDATFSLYGMPNGFNDDYWSNVPSALVYIYTGFPANPNPGHYSTDDLEVSFVGQIDEPIVDYDNGEVKISGRDLTAKFIDNKTSEKFQNQTASQIATLLANRRGLNPIVTPTTTKAGVFYQNDHTLLTSERPEWDLLVYLAQQEQFVVYVDGLNLIFKPKTPETADPYLIPWTPKTDAQGFPISNVYLPVFARSITLARDVIVIIRSWNSQTKKAFTATARSTHNKKTVIPGMAQPIGDSQTFSYIQPGLTPQQANQLAQRKLREISSQEINFSYSAPADNKLKKDSIIKTTGFGSGFNQIYYPDTIRRTMNFGEDGGYTMEVHAKNHSPISVVLV